MGIKQIQSWDAFHGHTHFLERAMSRRRFIRTMAGATGIALGSGLWSPLLAHAAVEGAEPKPVPNGIQPFGPGTEVFHVFLPEHGGEPATITDFIGVVGIADIVGSGIGTDTNSGTTARLVFDADVRFMEGHYLGKDGKRRRGTFGFV